MFFIGVNLVLVVDFVVFFVVFDLGVGDEFLVVGLEDDVNYFVLDVCVDISDDVFYEVRVGVE